MSVPPIAAAYDYVVVGMGTAGAILASRLSEESAVSVLALEAGESDGGLWESIPLGVGRTLTDDRRVWRQPVHPTGYLKDRVMEWASGRGIGGSASVNGMLFVRGHPALYDRWAQSAGDDWNYDHCLPYFQRLEDCDFDAGRHRSQGGPIGVQRVEADPVSEAFLAACASAGVQRGADYNDALPDGAFYLQLSARRGLRSGAGTAYLGPARGRSNLHLIKGGTVTRVLTAQGRANGVEFLHDGRLYTVKAAREVILCAGAVRSPQLLELSGIGRPAVLARHGIGLVQAIDQVGENLQDHFMARMSFQTPLRGTVNYMLSHWTAAARELARFAFQRRGLFATTTLKSTAFVRSDLEQTLPDLRIQLGLLSSEGRIPKGSGIDSVSSFHIGAYGLYPKSRGSVHIESGEPGRPPRVDPGYLDDESDRHVLLAGMQWIRRISAQESMTTIITKELRPGPDVSTSEALLEYAAATGDTCWHPVGTCRMGADAASVVDPACRVRGVSHLRVVDASVIPFLTSSNTNVPVMMLAERAADLIRNTWGSKQPDRQRAEELAS